MNVPNAGFFTADGVMPVTACVARGCQACKDSLHGERSLSVNSEMGTSVRRH